MAGIRQLLQDSTTWVVRFQQAITLLTDGLLPPPEDMIRAWFTTDNEELQRWAAGHAKRLPWAQGIEIIDAAERLADTPDESGLHEPRPADFVRPTVRRVVNEIGPAPETRYGF